MTDRLVLLDIASEVATLTLNRPHKRNALSGPMITAMREEIAHCADHPDVRLLVIKGVGEHFCAGADIEWMRHIAQQSYDDNYEDAQNLADLLLALYEFPHPTIALAHGCTLGGGMGLVAACDIVLATEDAQFGFPEVHIGLVPSTISPYVIRAIGARAVQYYALTAERFAAAEAMRLGLVQQVGSAEKTVLSLLSALIQRLMANGPHALAAVKGLVRSVSAEAISASLAQKTAEHLTEMRFTAEAKEGLQSFLDKRQPQWKREN